MPLITFMSDFGLAEHYIAAVKAKIYAENPSLQIVDISHRISSFNIAHAAFVMRAVYRDFPADTIHIIAVGSSSTDKHLIVRLDNQYFISADNGIVSLLSDHEPSRVVILPQRKNSTFIAKDLLATTSAKLALGKDMAELGTPGIIGTKKIPRQLKANQRQIVGSVIHVDHYGNLITNIDKSTFDVLSKEKRFEVLLKREKFFEIHENYFEVEYGECALFFNSLDLLEVSINHGNASQLLGLTYDSTIQIRFLQDE